MSDRFKPLFEGLGPLIKSLESRAAATSDLTSRVRAVIPAAEREHFIAASYREETLVISMDSAAWCSRVRYMQQSLIDSLHAGGEMQVTKIQVKVGRR